MMTVFFDVDTQIDFLYPAGALYVPGAERIVERVAALNRHAASRGIIVISSMDAHSEDDPEFRIWPHHCVPGTAGQQKPASTLLEKRVVVHNVVPHESSKAIHGGVNQILLEKQTVNCFTNVHLPALLDHLKADRYVVYGVVTEICVRHAAFGLLKTGKRVELVTDAVRGLDEKAGAAMIADFAGSGGLLTTVESVRASE